MLFTKCFAFWSLKHFLLRGKQKKFNHLINNNNIVRVGYVEYLFQTPDAPLNRLG